jgi:hypothetical protein
VEGFSPLPPRVWARGQGGKAALVEQRVCRGHQRGGSAMDDESAVEIREAMREQTQAIQELRDAVLVLAAATLRASGVRRQEAIAEVSILSGELRL